MQTLKLKHQNKQAGDGWRGKEAEEKIACWLFWLEILLSPLSPFSKMRARHFLTVANNQKFNVFVLCHLEVPSISKLAFHVAVNEAV